MCSCVCMHMFDAMNKEMSCYRERISFNFQTYSRHSALMQFSRANQSIMRSNHLLSNYYLLLHHFPNHQIKIHPPFSFLPHFLSKLPNQLLLIICSHMIYMARLTCLCICLHVISVLSHNPFRASGKQDWQE